MQEDSDTPFRQISGVSDQVRFEFQPKDKLNPFQDRSAHSSFVVQPTT